MKYYAWKESLNRMSRKELLEESEKIQRRKERLLRIQIMACIGSAICTAAICTINYL